MQNKLLRVKTSRFDVHSQTESENPNKVVPIRATEGLVAFSIRQYRAVLHKAAISELSRAELKAIMLFGTKKFHSFSIIASRG